LEGGYHFAEIALEKAKGKNGNLTKERGMLKRPTYDK